MKENELLEHLNEYRDANSVQSLVKFLKEKMVEELEKYPSTTDRQKHELNLLIRDLEEELNWIENEKLAEFDPEQQ